MSKSLPFATQDQQYPFSYLRMDGTKYPGIVLSGDMAVSPGTGLQVAITAGEAYVQQTVARLGAFYASRGLYYIFDDSADQPYNSITAPVTYPRVDQIIARVYDAYEQQLSGSSFWRYEWLTGTETSGTSLANLNGAATLPDNSLRLAYALATTSMSSWSSSNIVNWVSGNWITLSSLGLTNTTTSGYHAPAMRRNGDRVEFRGNGTFSVASVTLPSLFAPPSEIEIWGLSGTASLFVTVTSAGVITVPSSSQTALDGKFYYVTA